MDLYRAFCLLSSLTLLHIMGNTFGNSVENETQSSILFDQRQNGNYNVHLSIKDVAIIVGNPDYKQSEIDLADDYYYYDDNDITIQPIALWVSPAMNISQSSNNTVVPIENLSSSTENISTLNASMTKHNETLLSIIHTAMPPNSTLNAQKPVTTEIPMSSTSAKKTNVIIMNGTNEVSMKQSSNESLTLPYMTGGNIPVQILMDLPKQRTADSRKYLSKFNQQNHNKAGIKIINSDDSRIFHLKARKQFPQMINRKCNNDQFMDDRGNCRNKRASILNRLLTMLGNFHPTQKE